MGVGANHIEKFIIIKDIVDKFDYKDKFQNVTRHNACPILTSGRSTPSNSVLREGLIEELAEKL